MAITIDAVFAEKLGFASHQNAVPVLRDLYIESSMDVGVVGTKITLSADPPFLQQKTWHLEQIAPGDRIEIRDRNIALNAELLGRLTERVAGTISLTLTGQDGQEIASKAHSVELLAHNEWGGIGGMAELLPAFCMPNDPAVDQILRSAADILRRAGAPDALNGYASGSRSRVWEIASAIWSAIAGLRLAYALPPASFEASGQKIRTPSAVVAGGISTCLDTVLLFAACLEQAGLNPLLLLSEGHAFAGVWLQPLEFADLLTDEAAAVRRRESLHDMVIFETTLATQSPAASFSQAVESGRRQISEAAKAPFRLAIDVRRARLQKIRPLAVAGVEPTKPGGDSALRPSDEFEQAPELPAFDVEIERVPQTGRDRIWQWQRKLLNLTTSNRLLHLPDNAKVARLLCPDPSKLEQTLASGSKIKILPLPKLSAGGRDEELYEAQTQEGLRENIAREALDRDELLCALPKEKLDALLVDLYRKARSDIEDGGANTLYLSLGVLKWKKNEGDERAYAAPLILVPVKLERRSALSGVSMVKIDDDPRFNHTLLEMLRQDFELSIPELDSDLPTSSTGIDVNSVWASVRRAIKDIKGFEVTEEIVLGTFSFAKYLMWKDLADRSDRLKECSLVRHLIDRDGSGLSSSDVFPRPETLDELCDPVELFLPLPADSSQVAAIVASGNGHNFVLDGPPGTGKSQTIANMIAHNLALGRRVLFVAEKKAALDVVHRRLSEKGLAPFCLELHSAKATKTAVLKQLDRAWSTRDEFSQEEWTEQASQIRRSRDSLNAVAKLLNRTHPNGYSVQQAIGITIRGGQKHTLKLEFGQAAHSRDQFNTLRELARGLDLTRFDMRGLPTAFADIANTEWTNSWQESLVGAAQAIEPTLDRLGHATERLKVASALQIKTENRRDVGKLSDLCRLALMCFQRDLRAVISSNLARQLGAVDKLETSIAEYKRLSGGLSVPCSFATVQRIDTAAFSAEWIKASANFPILRFFAKRNVENKLAAAVGTDKKVSAGRDLPNLSRMKSELETIEGLSDVLGTLPGWEGVNSRSSELKELLSLATVAQEQVASMAESPEHLQQISTLFKQLVVENNQLLSPTGPVASALAEVNQALSDADARIRRFDELCNVSNESPFDGLRNRATAVNENAQLLNAWTNWHRAKSAAIDGGLRSLVLAIEAGEMPATSDAVGSAFQFGYARWFAATQIDAEPLLRRFASSEHDDSIRQFQSLMLESEDLAVRYIRARLSGLIPSKQDVQAKTGYAVLKHQLQLQRAHKPIRQLATDMGEAFTRLAPCMLMSPLSIAQYLPPDQSLFDLVIFDEASQIAPWDAIGAMARGKQVVVAGDPRQMPPTNFFTRTASDGGDDDTAQQDLESILDECLAAGVHQHSLDWHYRSRHESLIAFSNHRYYDGRLVTFPSSVTKASAVSWRRVEGVYARGSGRTNQIEAQAIVDEAVGRLRDRKFVDRLGKPLTLGIITLNAEQQKLVADLLDAARQRYPEIERHFSDEVIEPVFVKNLETVQGDERDLILLGMSFGPTVPGSKDMSMHFGALNGQGGWRRLNVATTRARQEMIVFTSFDAGMIDLGRTAARAVSDLKQLVEYADKGPVALASALKGYSNIHESPFESAVAEELKRRGWTVVAQIGVSRFRIDLGVVHPDYPGDFVVGVECDGATYHSAATARDRDKVRQSILEDLGWALVRVWSTDWWIDRTTAADVLHAKILESIEKDREDRRKRSATGKRGIQRNAPGAHGATGVRESRGERRIASQMGRTSALSTSNADFVTEHNGAARDMEPYRATDFGFFQKNIRPDRFFDDTYRGTLAKLVKHTLMTEGPIAESLLAQRIGRAHGFQRTSQLVKDKVLGIVSQSHHTTLEGDERFVWLNQTAAKRCKTARLPASEDDVRQIEQIALAEIRAAGRDGASAQEIARRFGVRRLSTRAKERIETALKRDR